MTITDFKNTVEITTIKQLYEFLEKRYEVKDVVANSFWLTHDARFPALSILVRNNFASIWYSASEDSPGFNSIGTVANLKAGNDTMFYFRGGPQPVTNESIITFAEALKVAEEFLHSQELPKSIKWLQL